MAPGGSNEKGTIYKYFISKHPELLYGGTNQYVKSFAEIGIIGFSIYLLALYKMINLNFFVWRCLLHCDTSTNFEKTISLSYFAIWLHYTALGLFNNDVWRFDITSLIFWFFSSIIGFLYFQHNSNCKTYLIRY